MRSANHRPLACWISLGAWLLSATLARAANAEDAPVVPDGAVPAAPAPPTAITPAPVDPGASPAAPDPVAPEPTPETPAPPAPVTPAITPEARPSAAPPTSSNAAFAPLPDAPREHAARKPLPPSTTAASEPRLPPGTSTTQPRTVADPSGKEDDDEWNGPFAPFRLGVLVGGGLPEVLNFGAQLKVTRFFGAGVNVGLIPTIRISYYGDATLAYQEYDLYGHLYPFGGDFFLGAGVGYATIHGTLATSFTLPADLVTAAKVGYGVTIDNPLSITSEANVRTLVLTPQLGFLHIFHAGFSVGLDVGAQIPIAPSQIDFATVAPKIPSAALQMQLNTQYMNPNDEKVRSSLDKIGRTPLPTFNLKIGWFL